jgi:hypothetical protein
VAFTELTLSITVTPTVSGQSSTELAMITRPSPDTTVACIAVEVVVADVAVRRV